MPRPPQFLPSAYLAFASLVPLMFSAVLDAQTPASAGRRWTAQLDQSIDEALSKGQIPGIAIAVVRNDTTLVLKGYGVRQLGQRQRVDPSTVFDIAGLTQSLTATAVAVLVDRGIVEWDAPVRRYLPDLPLPADSTAQRASLRDLLSHRSGLQRTEAIWRVAALDRGQILARARFPWNAAAFRRVAMVTNVGYTVAGEAAAAAARTTFESLLRDAVINPLRLTSTTWVYEDAPPSANVAGAHATIGGRQILIATETQRRSIAPATGLRSSAADLARWMRFHLNNGTLDGKRYVSDSAMREMHRLQIRSSYLALEPAARLMQDTLNGYGIGWHIAEYRGHRVLWQAGKARGQLAQTVLFPDDRLGITVLVNTSSVPDVHSALANRIADALLGLPPRDWAAEVLRRRTAADSARDAIQKSLMAMRSLAPPRAPRASFAGRYENPLFGPISIRSDSSGLTLQMGSGQVADLDYHGADAFYVRWRDPWLRENLTAHLAFTLEGDSVVSFATTMAWDVETADRDALSLEREPFTARKPQQAAARTQPAARADLTGVDAIVGRWNLRILAAPDVFGSWLEVERSGFTALVGRFVGLIGGARPIGKIEWSQGLARLTIPTEWETPSGDMRVEFRPDGDSLVGVMVRAGGKMRTFVGKRAPVLLRAMPAAWTEPVPLFNGRDLSGWTPAPTARALPNFWTVRDGLLVNTDNEGTNLMTVQRYQDFKLHVEFRLPPRGTSGIFPRGRYWVILGDRADTVPFRGTTGAVHGFLVPSEDAQRPANEWQSMDITMVGRRITIVLNGKPVIVNQIIPGITGSSIDIDEAAPGPIMLQGEETRVEFRNITISVPRDG